MNLRFLTSALFLVLAGSVAASQQTVKPPQIPTRNPRPDGRLPEEPLQSSSSREMLKEMELKREENDYKEHVARAKENAQLAAELKETFTRQKTLSAPDVKKLGRIEKLARQIRSRAGGEENKEELKDIPQEVAATFERLATLAAELEKKVESTPRHVVSSAIIKRANEIVELAKHLRTIYR